MSNKNIQRLRFFVALFATIIYVAGFLGFFYPLKLFDINIAPLIQRVFVDITIFSGLLLFLVFLATALLGRIYCSTLCPLGLFQELSLIIFHRKKLPQQKNRGFKYFIAILTFGTLFAGTASLMCLIDPYTIFSSMLSVTTFGISAGILIIILTGINGRLFCTNICPVGTLLGVISRHAYNKIYINTEACVACGLCAQKCPSGCIDFKNKTVNNETCIKCFKCLTLCHNHGLNYGHNINKTVHTSPSFSASRRQFIIKSTALAITLVGAYKAGIKLSSDIASKVKNILLPAGAGSAERFANKCLNCNLCVENCPMKILTKKDSTFPTIHIDFGKNYCSYNCNKCSEICPSGAIRRQSLEEKRKTQIGISTFNYDSCIQCGLCVRECPRSAITKEQGDFPIVDTDICIGCGACQAVCPVSAIKVIPVKTQKILSK